MSLLRKDFLRPKLICLSWPCWWSAYHEWHFTVTGPLFKSIEYPPKGLIQNIANPRLNRRECLWRSKGRTGHWFYTFICQIGDGGWGFVWCLFLWGVECRFLVSMFRFGVALGWDACDRCIVWQYSLSKNFLLRGVDHIIFFSFLFLFSYMQ